MNTLRMPENAARGSSLPIITMRQSLVLNPSMPNKEPHCCTRKGQQEAVQQLRLLSLKARWEHISVPCYSIFQHTSVAIIIKITSLIGSGGNDY